MKFKVGFQCKIMEFKSMKFEYLRRNNNIYEY